MKSKNIIHSLGLAAMMAVSATTYAHGGDDSRMGANSPAFNGNHPAFQESLRMMKEINDRQDQQHDRILDGFYDKRITMREFRRLMDQQRDIRNMERTFLADGFLTRFEYQKLDAALDNASRSIYKEAHDAQGRPGYAEGYGNRSR